MTNPAPDQLAQARAHWRWRGADRPPFAEAPAPGQTSVWDFPRPPELVHDAREIVVRWGALEVARTRGAWAVRETAHPPTFYLPLSDVDRSLLRPAGGGSFCEWKGPARYWDLADGARRLAKVAWSYPQPLAGAEPLSDCIAFYAHDLAGVVHQVWRAREIPHRGLSWRRSFGKRWTVRAAPAPLGAGLG